MLRTCIALVALGFPTVTSESVAIIGGGFTGASAAYYLEKLCPKCYDVHLYESRDRIGGRVFHADVPNSSLVVNVGGDAWSSVNTYMMELMKELKIEEPTFPDRDYNTSELYLGPGRGWAPLPTNTSVDPKYNRDKIALGVQIERIKLALDLHYVSRGSLEAEPYDTIDQYAKEGGLDKFSSVTTRALLTENGVDIQFVTQFVEALSRDIYDQTTSLNGFAGMAVMLSATTPEYSAAGGNDAMVKAILNASGAAFDVNSGVTEVEMAGEQLLITVNGTKLPYDRIVVTAPIEQVGVFHDHGVLTPMKWTNITLPKMKMRTYVHWYVIWVVADAINPAFIGRTNSTIPDLILTPEGSTARFVKLATEYDLNPTQKVFRFFANYELDDLEERFVNIAWNITHHWPYTFPMLDPEADYQPTKLHDRIYYPNALESMAVAMECAVTGGRNAAQQIHRDVKNGN